jgi:hypothetical protein
VSAAQNLGRMCPDCNQPLASEHPNAVRHAECQRLHKNQISKARRASKFCVDHDNRPRPEHKSLRKRQVDVRRVSAADTEPRSPNVIECQVCCDMPWARGTDRRDSNWVTNGVMATDGIVRCRGCHRPHEAEPRPEQMSVLGSSAAMAANHGHLFGEAKTYQNRPSRARVKVDG